MTSTLSEREKTLSQVRFWRGEVTAADGLLAEEGSESEGGLHLKDLLPRILARWHWIAVGLLLGMSLGLLGIWRAVPVYQAQATLQVKDSTLSVVTGESVAEELNLRASSAMNTVIATLRRSELAEAVAADEEVRALPGLVPASKPFLSSRRAGATAQDSAELPPAKQLAPTIQDWMKVSVRRNTRLIDIQVKHPVPEVAKTVANKYISLFIVERELQKKLGITGSLAFLKREADRISESLQDTHALLAGYASALEAEKKLAQAEKEIAILKLRYREKHPRMIEANAHLDQMRMHLAEMLERAARNPSDDGYWKDHLERLGSPRDPQAMREYRELLVSRSAVLRSEIESESSFHQSLLDQKGSREVSKERAKAEVLTHQQARVPVQPVSPHKTRMLIKASALGLLGGVALAFLFQYFDNRLHTVSDVENAIGLPVLAAVAALEVDESEESGTGGKEAAKSPGWRFGQEKWAPTVVFREGQSETHAAEMFRVLRTSISLLGPLSHRKITMITSALPSEGKTLVAANLAVAMAQQGMRTLLVDFDLRKPSVHKLFGEAKDDRPGIADLLVGKAQPHEVLRTDTGQENLFEILAGAKPPNPGELLESSRLSECLKLFRDHFDHVILDTAPLLPVPDSRVLAPLVDIRCLVVRAESTPVGAVKRAVSTLESSGSTPEGIVFNGYVEKRLMMSENYSYSYYREGRNSCGGYGSVYGDDDD